MGGSNEPTIGLALVGPDLDPSTREGNTFLATLTYLVQAAIMLVPLIIVKPNGLGVVLWLVGLLPVAFAIGHHLRSIHLDQLALKDRIGFATLTTERIGLELKGVERDIPLKPRTEISITTRCFQGKPTWRKNRPTHSGIASLKVTDQHDELPFQVLVRTKAEEQQLVEVIKSWYLAGLNVRESVYGISSFLLRTDRTYDELQRLKKEYGLTQLWPVSKADPHFACAIERESPECGNPREDLDSGSSPG